MVEDEKEQVNGVSYRRCWKYGAVEMSWLWELDLGVESPFWRSRHKHDNNIINYNNNSLSDCDTDNNGNDENKNDNLMG